MNRTKYDSVILLKKLGVNPAIKGWTYLNEAIQMSVDDPTVMEQVTKRMYPAIAKKCNTTPMRVERAIRHAVEQAFFVAPTEVISAAFGNSIDPRRGKATNSQFIATLVNLITTEPDNPIWSM